MAGKRESGSFTKYQIRKGDLKLNKHPKYGYGFYLYQIDLSNFLCVKGGITYSQIVSIVENYIRKNPKEWHKDIVHLIDSAVKKSKIYDCDARDYKEDKIQKYIKQSN